MSDSWIVLVPTDPHFVPPVEVQERARVALAKFAPGADEVKVILHDSVQFFDCGENFTKVSCPACGAVLDTEWWQEHMDVDYDTGFKLSPCRAPCCGAEVTLNQLDYDWPQGFGRFAVEAINPLVGRLDDDQIRVLCEAVGHPLRIIYQHI